MGEQTGISWTDHTFNPWTGCTRVSPGCDNCYAATLAKRNTKTFGGWEPGDERKRTSSENWKQPRKWNRAAADLGIGRRVFCASMADVFDNKASAIWREDLWELIRETPSLDWQLLTKRPQNIAKMLPRDWGDGYPNVWLGTTVENQEEANRRIPHLLRVPARMRFLSCEPLLEHVDLAEITDKSSFAPKVGDHCFSAIPDPDDEEDPELGYIHWVIIGGESGGGAREMEPEWAWSLIDQCELAGVAVWVKQLGTALAKRWGVGKPGMADPMQWPSRLRVQQMPLSAPPVTL